MKLTSLWAGIFLTLASFGAYAGESRIAQAIKDAEAGEEIRLNGIRKPKSRHWDSCRFLSSF